MSEVAVSEAAEELLEDPLLHGSSQPDRRPAPVVRALPADEPAPGRAGSVRAPGGVHERFPVRGLPRGLRAAVRQVRDRQLGVQVRPAQGPGAPAHGLPLVRRPDRDGPSARGGRLLRQVRRAEPEQGDPLRRLRQPRRPPDEVLGGRVPGAGDDLLRSPEGHLPSLRLRQGPRDGRQDHAGREGRGSLLRGHPADDRARHVRHQRHRARHRLPAPPLAGRLLHEGVGARVPREDHSRTAGPWVEFEYDQKGVLFVRIDRKRKFPATIFLRALGSRPTSRSCGSSTPPWRPASSAAGRT